MRLSLSFLNVKSMLPNFGNTRRLFAKFLSTPIWRMRGIMRYGAHCYSFGTWPYGRRFQPGPIGMSWRSTRQTSNRSGCFLELNGEGSRGVDSRSTKLQTACAPEKTWSTLNLWGKLHPSAIGF